MPLFAFWLPALLFLVLVISGLAFLFFLGEKRAVREVRQNSALDLLPAEIAELERKRESGEASREEALALKNAYERQLLEEMEEGKMQKTANGPTSRPALFVFVTFALLAPLSGLILYISLGSPVLPGAPLNLRQNSPTWESVLQLNPEDQQAFMLERIAELEVRLESQPDNFEGWMLLARSRTMLGEPERAAVALDRAYDLQPSPELARTRADAYRSLLRPGQPISAEMFSAFDDLLMQDSGDLPAIIMTGLYFLQEGQREAGLERLELARGIAPDDHPLREQVEKIYEEAAAQVQNVD